MLSSVAVKLATALLSISTPQIPVAGQVEPVDGFPGAVPAAVLMSQVVTMTNQARNAAGCPQVAVDHDLIDASVNQSYFMASTGTFSHIGDGGSTFVVRAQSAGYREPAAENIAWGYATAGDVMAAWMASEHHRENILNCRAKSVGTGVVYALNGLPYYTEVFGWE